MSDIGDRPEVLDRLPAAYGPLFDRLRAVCESDDRVRALWLSGSLARGVADEGSDLDVVIAVRSQDFAAYADDWRGWLADITPVVIARPIGDVGGSFYSMTPECLRLDVVAEPASAVSTSPHRHRLLVFDRDGLDASVPMPEHAQPDVERIAFLVEEFYRMLGIYGPAVIARRDWMLGVEGIQGQRRMLYELFVESNRPLPPMGVKQWSSKLTPPQREVLAGLPPLDNTPQTQVPALRATIEAYAVHARAVHDAFELSWPTELVAATTSDFERYVAGLGDRGRRA